MAWLYNQHPIPHNIAAHSAQHIYCKPTSYQPPHIYCKSLYTISATNMLMKIATQEGVTLSITRVRDGTPATLPPNSNAPTHARSEPETKPTAFEEIPAAIGGPVGAEVGTERYELPDSSSRINSPHSLVALNPSGDGAPSPTGKEVCDGESFNNTDTFPYDSAKYRGVSSTSSSISLGEGRSVYWTPNGSIDADDKDFEWLKELQEKLRSISAKMSTPHVAEPVEGVGN
jgi:hypothetical protein